MKPSEFYEKYWKIKNADGTLSDSKPLTQTEKDSLDEVLHSSLNVFYMTIERKSTKERIDIDVEDMYNQMKNLPK